MSSQCSDQNRFQFAKSSAVDDIVLLNASMTDFTYGKHAHEEFSIGVTLRGRQDFLPSANSIKAIQAVLSF
jgi:transcriptional regulator, AraC family